MKAMRTNYRQTKQKTFAVVFSVLFISFCNIVLAAHPIGKASFICSTGCKRICPQNNHVETRLRLVQQSEEDRDNFDYKSKSTAHAATNTEFYKGAEERRQRLHRALNDIGIATDDDGWLESPDFRGSAALRTYNSFILPKSSGALEMTKQPQRAAVVANSISFLMREHRSHQQEWLRNHDRSVKEAMELQKKEGGPEITIILDDIRSAHNVGNIIRAAEASRCRQVLLCGSMTPSPPHPKVLKTALGAAEYVPYKSSISTLEAVQELKSEGYKIFGIETTSRSRSLWQIPFFTHDNKEEEEEYQNENFRIALVFGNELVGVDTKVLEVCDHLVAVPTHGIKNSLNVATCASIIIWEALRQWEKVQTESIE